MHALTPMEIYLMEPQSTWGNRWVFTFTSKLMVYLLIHVLISVYVSGSWWYNLLGTPAIGEAHYLSLTTLVHHWRVPRRDSHRLIHTLTLDCLVLPAINLVGSNIDWGLLLMHWILYWLAGLMRISTICKGHWQSPCIALKAGKYLPSGLCKETVKESEISTMGLEAHS